MNLDRYVRRTPAELPPRRRAVYQFICDYACERNGVTPPIMTIARNMGVSFSTARGHVTELALARLIRLEDRQIIVEDSEWVPPDLVRFKAL